ncbi:MULTISPECIES: AzlD domain-containing protein [Thermus]|uniref:AzlD domain-containing protein n=1 Tax=Thermus TaxID=270 RepID=UPI001F2003BF|nr:MULTISPECIES: AzlD domain-containing protein [Thermus]
MIPILVLALGTLLLRYLPWRGERGPSPGQAGPALAVALFLVSAFGPPPSWLWAKTLAALLVVSLAFRLSRRLGLSVLLGMAAYALF